MAADLGKKLLDGARNGHLKHVEEAIKNQVDVNFCEPPYNKSALIYAAYKGFDNIIKVLLEKGADINQADGEGRTALHEAAFHGKLSTVQLLCDRGANYNLCDEEGHTPLARAILGKATAKQQVIDYLVSKGVSLNITDPTELTVVHHASFVGMREYEHLLYYKGAFVNRYNLSERKDGVRARGEWLARKKARDDERARLEREKSLAEKGGKEEEPQEEEPAPSPPIKRKRRLLPFGNTDAEIKLRRELFAKWDVDDNRKLSVNEALRGLQLLLAPEKGKAEGRNLTRQLILRAFKHAMGIAPEAPTDIADARQLDADLAEMAEQTFQAVAEVAHKVDDITHTNEEGGEGSDEKKEKEGADEEGEGAAGEGEGEAQSVPALPKKHSYVKQGTQSEQQLGFESFRKFLFLANQYWDLAQLFAQMDLDNNRKVDFDEFVKGEPLLKEWGCYIEDPVQEFFVADLNNSGCITFLELCEYCWANSYSIPEEIAYDEHVPNININTITKRRSTRMTVREVMGKSETWDPLIDLIPAGKLRAKERDALFDRLDTHKGSSAGLLSFAEITHNLRKELSDLVLPGSMNLQWPIKAAFDVCRKKEMKQRGVEAGSLDKDEFALFCLYLKGYLIILRMYEEIVDAESGLLDLNTFRDGWERLLEWGLQPEGDADEAFAEMVKRAASATTVSAQVLGQKTVGVFDFFLWAASQNISLLLETPEASSNGNTPEPPAGEGEAEAQSVPVSPEPPEEEEAGKTEGESKASEEGSGGKSGGEEGGEGGGAESSGGEGGESAPG
uniref:EF-hand domain-containing protein n=1 Tax=Chromera velia CCMP2878 TaxID=1169474 RepID=A0A0G4HXP8_9ALVE|eukprot:Cvel_9307.t1-p1 / transcript=Cvel_9307.t1 / gene=Cvel_9307 / organism=Chromera_velia_CCMP2878 / gene_product=Putative ankyrin repeat protein MM_0045, putative / transcript_product=Putative ankyrin repeat protein MM_0045, putative / location=Cvel_scaffold533:39353-49779(-) / protein_length=787 / sequence_SO=supercontig / SO=protein_coding / is_pseudo=false